MLLVLDLVGTFAFALNGALTAIRVVDVDLVGVLTLGIVTAVGGGIVGDVLLGALTGVGGGTVRDVLIRRSPTSCAPASTPSRPWWPRGSSCSPAARGSTRSSAHPRRSPRRRRASPSGWSASASG